MENMENEDSLSHPFESSVLFHGNDIFVNKLSRSSLSSSEQYSLPRVSETYICKLPGTVPFKWEVQPGIPKDPPNEEEDSSSIPLESSPRLKKDSSLKSNNQNQIIKKRSPSLTGPTSCFFKRSKKTLKKSPKFSHSESTNSDDHGYFSSACASKSSSSTSATTESSPSSKALVTSSSMSSKFPSLAKRLLRKLF